MKVKFLATLLASCLLFGVASAQTYTIRVNDNTNLRASYSLQSAIVETVSAGATLNVIGSHNRWLQINRNSNEVWMANWVGHTRVEETAPTQPQTVTNVDICCFVDRQCNTDQEWTDGYWALQNGQCAAPAQSQGQISAQPVTTASTPVDNCCNVDRQCHTEKDWTDGYWDFQNNQCGASTQSPGGVSTLPTATDPGQADNCCFIGWQCNSDEDWLTGFYAFQENRCKHPGVKIEGAPNFVALIETSLDLLQSGAPHLYEYGVTGLNEIKMVPPDSGRGILISSRTFIINHAPDYVHGERDTLYVAGEIVHEACHSHQWDAGTATAGWRNEINCVQLQLQTYEALDPRDRYGIARWLRNLIANIENPAYWWW